MDYIETSGLISLTDIHVSLDIRVPQTFVADCTLLRFAFQRVKLTLTDQKQTTMNVISGVVLHPTNIEPQIIRKYEYYRFIYFFFGGGENTRILPYATHVRRKPLCVRTHYMRTRAQSTNDLITTEETWHQPSPSPKVECFVLVVHRK